MRLRHLIVVGALMELAFLSFYFVDESPDEVLWFVGVNAFAYVLLGLVVWKTKAYSSGSESSRDDRLSFLWIFGFAILFRLTLVFHSPVGSDDIYRYVWDGKVAAHGINPFRHAPTDSTLMFLRTDALPSLINHPTMRTIYPPLAQVFFFLSYKLFGESLAGMKSLLVLADIASILLLVQIGSILSQAEDRTLRPNRGLGFVMYAWSPLPIMYFGLDGHIDALGISFFLMTIYLILKNKTIASAVSLGLAGLAKLYPLIVAPFLFGVRKDRRRRLAPVIPAAILVLGCALYWEPTGGLIESFRVFSSEFAFNGSFFKVFYGALGSNGQAHLISSIAFCAWLGVVFILDRTFVEKCFLAFLGFIIFSPVVHPWYLTWMAAMLSIRWSPSVFALLALSSLSNLTVYHYHLDGHWEESTWILLVEYVPFYALLGREFARRFSVVTSFVSLLR